MYKVAIVGLGNMGQVHIDAYKKIGNVEIVAVIDMNMEATKKVANELNCGYFDSVEALSQSNISVDIVDICVPTSFHIQTIKQSADICKNIICEKPICIGYDNVLKLKKIVEDNGLSLMIAHVLRFWDGYLEIKGYTDKGDIKNINSVVCYRRQKVPKWSKDSWLFDVNISGGIIYDLLIHDIDYVVWLFGKPKKVLANVAAYECDVQRHAKLELIYDNGFTASNNLVQEREDIRLQAVNYLQEWHDDMMMIMDSPTDPLWTVMKEGGPFHARGTLKDYCKRLKETGRVDKIKIMKQRYPEEF